MSDPIKEIKIYKLSVQGDNNNFYIGSSRQADGERFRGHKSSFKTEKNRKVYKYFAEKGGEIKEEVLARYNAPKSQQLIIEQEWLDKLKPTLNSCRAYTPPEVREQLRQKRYWGEKLNKQQKREKKEQDMEEYWKSLSFESKKILLNEHKKKCLTETLRMMGVLTPTSYDYETWKDDLQKDIEYYSVLF